jgi:hypothetical protein
VGKVQDVIDRSSDRASMQGLVSVKGARLTETRSGCPASLEPSLPYRVLPYCRIPYYYMFRKMAGRSPLVVPALKRHTATVIVAHGLGDSGAGWYVALFMCTETNMLTVHRIFLAENWRRRSKFEEVSFIFPNAPNIPITLVRNSTSTEARWLLTSDRIWA